MAHLDHSSVALQAGIASELRRFRLELERVAELLVSDPYFVTLYLGELQVFDFLGQCADENAAVLDRLADGSPPEAAVAQVRLDVVQDRLRAAMAAGAPAQARAA